MNKQLFQFYNQKNKVVFVAYYSQIGENFITNN